MLSALVVDDQSLVSSLLKTVLEQHDFTCETAADVAQARHILEEFDPDIMIVDLHLGQGPSGFELADYVAKNLPHVAILAMSQYSAPELIGRDKSVLPESASFISKGLVTDSKALLEAIDAAINSEKVVRALAADSPLSNLTATQLEVLRMMAEGYRTAEIAAARKTTVGACEQSITNMYKNLGIEDTSKLNQRSEAMRIYIAHAGLPERYGSE